MKPAFSLIEQFYDQNVSMEWGREERHRTEFAITRRILKKFLPEAPARLLDCGGGPGRYAIGLARQGYAVTLFDISGENLRWAQAKAAEAGVPLEGFEHGSAVDLTCFGDGIFDAVLLMGPLYHLLQAAERQKAMQEAMRVLKPGGLLFAAFINRYGVLRDLALKNAGGIVQVRQSYQGILDRGLDDHDDSDEIAHFKAFFFHPNEAVPFVRSAGFQVEGVFGVEGVASALESQLNPLDGAAWEAWEELNWQVAQDTALLGGADHFLVVARKPAWRDVLRQVCQALNAEGIRYKVVGGTALVLRGLLDQSQDIDIETGEAGAYRFQEIFNAQVELPVALRQSDQYRSHIGRFRFGQVQVEVMGDIQRREGSAWVRTGVQTESILELEGVQIHTGWIEEECLALMRRGKLERAALCLPACDAGRLLSLIRGETFTEVI